MRKRLMSRLFLLGAGAALSLLAAAARAEIQPEPLPPAPPIAPPRDIPYPGVLKLSVDATDLDHAIFTMHETVPVAGPGPLVLLYPRWLPGNHSPSGPIDKLASLKVSAGGQPLTWTRDPVDVYAFHVDAPAGVSAVDVDFQFLSAVSTREGHVDMSRDMLALEWNDVALYPAGYFTRDIRIDASVTLPKGFTPATALETASTDGPSVTFKTTTFNTLVDSPLMAGRYFKKFDLDPGGPARVTLDVMADAPEDLEVTPEQLAAHKNLVRQAYKLYASHHYDHYDFLLWLSDKIGGAGLEHHQSSEDGTAPNYFTEWDKGAPLRDLLAHEYTHSWNGKFRRPADLWTPSFNVPMRDSLLWVYEGQTQYWGYVLAARAGLLTRQQALDAIASTAASYDHVVGRTWRALEDTTNDPIIAERRPLSWRAWERSEDYYSEGELIWLDADTLIRKLSGGQRSLDDFAAGFFGVRNGSFVTDTYTFDDVVAALNAVQPYDWAKFLRERLDGHGPGAPLDGLARGGYRLVYTDKPTAYFKDAEARRKIADFTYSIGLAVSTATPGALSSVLWDGPAFKAGMTQADKIVAVNGEAFSVDGLKAVIARSGPGEAPISLLLENKNQFRTVSITYEGGLRYPKLERIGDGPSSLDAILTPKP
jgi:predicted metalloprotease with PDZ domain